MKVAGQMSIEDRPTMPLKVWRKKRRYRKRAVLFGGLLFLFLTGSASAVAGYGIYATYHTDLSLAQAGLQHMRSAVALLESLQSQPFAPQTVARAQQEFAGALNDSQTIESQLANFSGLASIVPIYGSRLTAAIRLSALAVDASQAGIHGCNILEILTTRLSNPLKASPSGLTMADFTTISSEYQKVKASLNAAINDALLLHPADLSVDAHLLNVMQEFRANIPEIRIALAEVDQLLPALPALLGISTPAHYLIEIMDSTEIRPGGGFIGNYGIATLSGGKLVATHISDSYMLSNTRIAFPASYQWFAQYLRLSSWSLRDSNLEADFPTDARYGELNYQRQGGNVPLQGVIAITPFFIEQVLNITGPLNMPEYHESVTAQNLVSLIHLHQLGQEGSSAILSADGQTSQRKYFTELLGERLLARIQQLPATDLPALSKVFTHAVQTKDVQVYFNANAAENILQHYGFADTIEAANGDSLFVVDANVGASKANNYITSTVSDRVTIDNKGNAIHQVTLQYAWTKGTDLYSSGLYEDYVRVFVPPGSVLLTQQGWQSQGTNMQFGHQVWAGFFTLTYGQTNTISLKWISYNTAKSDANGWHYQYVLQRQAGILRTLSLEEILPSCATVTGQRGGLLSKNKLEEAYTGSFTQDLNLAVDYICK